MDPRLYPRLLLLLGATFTIAVPPAFARNAPPPGQAQKRREHVVHRDDVRALPDPLRDRLGDLAARPSTFPPMTAFAEADQASQLFQYYLLDTNGFEPNIFTTTIPGINDGAIPTATGPNGDLPTIGAVRVVLEPKPGLPTDANDPGAFIDIFTDISGLFVINNESGWYEGWMIHDLVVPPVAGPRPDGHAQFGTMTVEDAAALAARGSGNDAPGSVFTTDGNAVHPPSESDHFPDQQSNVVPIQLSMGAYNCVQQSDCHSYWEFNEYTDWVHPLYELPFTGGIPGTFEAGQIGARQSIVPGSGPSGVTNDPVAYGDDPNNPRDPDRGPNVSPDDIDRPAVNNDDHKEKRLRFIPSGLANEVLLDAYVRVASFEPAVTDLSKRIFDAYAAEVARIDENGDGVVTFIEADLEDTSDGGQPNDRLYLPATAFNRFAVTREINDGLLAPRFAPSQRGWVLSGALARVSPSVNASVPRDADNR
ncbi:MAG TPA: hypothetical protein VLF14_00150 [Candidatus Binatia bacterium]|nr:hypothetical protein [Candidatus Binatia bacterium]